MFDGDDSFFAGGVAGGVDRSQRFLDFVDERVATEPNAPRGLGGRTIFAHTEFERLSIAHRDRTAFRCPVDHRFAAVGTAFNDGGRAALQCQATAVVETHRHHRVLFADVATVD